MYKGKDRELQFPHAVCVSYQNGDRGKSGEVVRGYVACDLTDRTPKQVEILYQKRSAIETSYRTYHKARAITTTPDPLIRFILVAVSFLLRNLWLVVRWAVVARPRQGGRDVPTEFTFELVCGWIRDHLSADLGWQYTWKSNTLVCRRITLRPWPDLSQAAGLPFPSSSSHLNGSIEQTIATLTGVSVCCIPTGQFVPSNCL